MVAMPVRSVIAPSVGSLGVVQECPQASDSHRQALERAHSIAARANVTIHIVDVGRALPIAYPEMSPPLPEDYFNTIVNAVQSLPMFSAAEL